MRRGLGLLVFLILAALLLSAAKKKREDGTEILELPKDPPPVAVGETKRLVFKVSPLIEKGLLTAQTREALKALLRDNAGSQIIHVRAFLAGSGDLRRVPQIVSEIFTEKKLPLPSVSVVQVGVLPSVNAQVVMESVAVAKKDMNPEGLGFFASDLATGPDPSAPAKPLVEKALAQLKTKAGGASANLVTCFVSSVTNPGDLSTAVSAAFPGAAANVVQSQRAPYQGFATCSAITRGGSVKAPRLAFTGTRVAFGNAEKDATLAFQRLEKDLTDASAQPGDIAFFNLYPQRMQTVDAVKKLRGISAEMLAAPFESVSTSDAPFAVDAIAALQK